MQQMVSIIDDEDSIRESLKALFDAVGWKANAYATAAGYLSARSEPGTEQSHCLLIDIQLPDMNGLDLLTELNRRESSIPTIVMTGHGDEDLETRASERNAVGYFQKPFDTTELLNTISGVLAQTP
ncbi:MAG: response regulator transcription factor [Planctomycetales bacterium]|jgi:FixJ family two-component response regulator